MGKNIGEVLAYIKGEGAVTASQLEKQFDLGHQTVRTLIGRLLIADKIRWTTVRMTNGVFWYISDGRDKQTNPFSLRKKAKGQPDKSSKRGMNYEPRPLAKGDGRFSDRD